MGVIRLHPDDVAGEPYPAEAGHYQSCTDCIDKFRLKVLARQVQAGAVAPERLEEARAGKPTSWKLLV